jgi:RNA polymerase-binding transcription factor DksA
MNAAKLAHFETLLLQDRKRATSVLRRIAMATTTANEGGERPPFRDEPEAGAAGGGPQDDVAIEAHEAVALLEIDGALRRLHDTPERYGVCATCGRPISDGRLEIVPETSFCDRHAPWR